MATKKATEKRTKPSTATSRVSARSKQIKETKRMITGIGFVVILFCTILIAKTWNAHNTLKELKTQKKELTAEYNAQLKLSEELKKKEEYVQTDEYIEEMARKLGLVYPDEVIFKPQN